LFEGEALEEKILHLEAALGGAFVLVEGRGLAAEFGDEGVAVGGVVLAEEILEVGVEGAFGDLQVALDAVVGPAVEEAAEDLVAAGGGAVELADAGAFAAAELEPGGWGDFVAEKQAGGEVGDEVVPAALVEGGEMEDVVAFGAGEGGWRIVIRMADKNVCPTKFEGRVGVEEAGEEAHGEGVVDFADLFFAAGAEPAPTDESVVVGVLVARMADKNVRPTTHPFGIAAKQRGSDDGLFEVVGEEIGEPGPGAAEDGVGGLEKPGAAGEERAVIVEDGDGLAALAAEEGDCALAEKAANAGAMEHGW